MQRKKFIQGASALVAGWTIVPRSVLGRGFIPPSDQLAIAGIGAGNRGLENLKLLAADDNNRIVSLCDVDDRRSVDARKTWDKASYYADYREMLDKTHKQLDAVVVSIPDHNHAVATMAAMQLGKHVYCETPLTHDLYEARTVQAMARRYRVITQMGNQGSSADDSRKIRHWIEKGIIGEVTKVHIWTTKKLLNTTAAGPQANFQIPPELKWLLWLGTAPDRNYHPGYLDGGWKMWQDFGTGALGSEGPHLFDVPLSALGLDVPVAVQVGVGAAGLPGSQPPGRYPEHLTIHFRCHRQQGPAVELIWYDRGLFPPRPPELAPEELLGDAEGGMLFEGSKYKLVAGYYGRNPRIIPTSIVRQLDLSYAPDTRYSIITHQTDWATACRTGRPGQLPGDFQRAGPLTETVLLGNVALLSYYLQSGGNYPGRKELLWDSAQLRITNYDAANQFTKREYAHGYRLIG